MPLCDLCFCLCVGAGPALYNHHVSYTTIARAWSSKTHAVEALHESLPPSLQHLTESFATFWAHWQPLLRAWFSRTVRRCYSEEKAGRPARGGAGVVQGIMIHTQILKLKHSADVIFAREKGAECIRHRPAVAWCALPDRVRVVSLHP